MQADIWPVVLGGGAGRRLQRTTGGVPRQFWRSSVRASGSDSRGERVTKSICLNVSGFFTSRLAGYNR